MIKIHIAIELISHKFANTWVIVYPRSIPNAAGICWSPIIRPIPSKNHWSAEVGISTIYLLKRKTAISKIINHPHMANIGKYAIPYVIAIGSKIPASEPAGP
jgi:hypothetical protein